ncbi:DUF4255 domain-containing protein [Paenibacillus contaminans]|uniref:DUF4255 domain-containing protein n=1 Tax=Paenibacillus contaminans TaxID=450362 RepID=UPI001313E514|nr:DUF4255 domain-containing protein [Paenibacillus contaminans]
MSGTAIADVGSTLIKLLRDKLDDLSPDSIKLHSPADLTEVATPTRLTLFMYNVLENPYMRFQDTSFPQEGPFRMPPLVLDLYYMLTAYSTASDLTERTLEEHEILGRAMSVLHDNASLGDESLQGGLAGSDQNLRITLNPVMVPELSDIWTAFSSLNLRPSVCYIVSPLQIQSARQNNPARVQKRILQSTFYDVNDSGRS